MKKELRFPQFTTLRYTELKKSGLSILQWHIAEFVMFMEMQFDDKQVQGLQTVIADIHMCNVKSVQRSIEVLLEKGYLKKTSRKSMSTTRKWLELITLPNDEESGNDPQNGNQTNPPADSAQRKEYEAKMSAEDHANWLTFWDLYKTINYRDRENACKVFAKHTKHFTEIMFGLHHYISDLADNSWQQPKMASAWLNAKRWVDYEGKGEPKKIANGAAAPKSSMEAFRSKCVEVMYELFDGGNSWKFDEAGEELKYGFDERGLKAINDLGGFAVVMKTCTDGDFVSRLQAVWEGE
jgi:hypothetical protein